MPRSHRTASASSKERFIPCQNRQLRTLFVGEDGTESDISTLTNKLQVLPLRVFSDSPDSTSKTSIKDVDGVILCISQFALMAETRKGNKPDFHNAMSTQQSRMLYGTFLATSRQSYKPEKVQGNVISMMNVSLSNKGPVTFILDSRRFEYAPQAARPTKQAKNQSSVG
ncbi:D-Tyr-tRNA deacylase-domain-containing protein [Mycena latifolia]|nr:D-Tyr-tRNA deacylase-domain-containing protein [Mycena latifolia]